MSEFNEFPWIIKIKCMAASDGEMSLEWLECDRKFRSSTEGAFLQTDLFQLHSI